MHVYMQQIWRYIATKFHTYTSNVRNSYSTLCDWHRGELGMMFWQVFKNMEIKIDYDRFLSVFKEVSVIYIL